MEYFLEGIFFGMLVAVSPGPSTLYVIEKTIQDGRKAGIFASIGITIADAFYAVLAIIGVTSLLAEIPEVTVAFWFICGTLLIFIGYTSFQRARLNEFKSRLFNHSHPFFGAILLDVFNPATIVFWVTVTFTFFAPIQPFTYGNLTPAPVFLLSAGVIAGLFIFFNAIALLTARQKSKETFSQVFWKRGAEIIGIILLGIGVYFLYRGFLLLL